VKRILLIALLIAVTPAAFAANSALTPKGTLYAIDAKASNTAISITRRSGDTKETLVVPVTADDARDHDAQIEYDRLSDRLYVVWTRDTDDASELVMSWLNGDDTWSPPLIVANASPTATRSSLHTVLTRTTVDEVRHTLIHVAAWLRDGIAVQGEYTIVAFEGVEYLSSSVADFEKLAGNVLSTSGDGDVPTDAIFPPLALAAAGDGTALVFGRDHGTTVTRLHITPKLDPNARIWKPLGRDGEGLPPARLVTNSVPKAFFSGDRVVLYIDEDEFRYVVYEEGQWSSVRTFKLDSKLTGESLVNELKRMIAEETPSTKGPVTQQ